MVEHPWSPVVSPYILDLLSRHGGEEFAELLPKFVRGMIDRILMSAPKYGKITPEVVKGRDWMKSIQLRLDKFGEDGNTEWLMDVANFMVMMSTFPCHPQWHFRSTTSEESPGIIIGSDQRHLFHPQDRGVVERHLRDQRSGD